MQSAGCNVYLQSGWSAQIHPSEEEEANELMSVSVDRNYLSLVSAIYSYSHVCSCTSDTIQPEEGQLSARGTCQPPHVSGSTTAPNSTRKSRFACAAALLQNLNEV